MRPDDVYELADVSDPRVSPDGTRVAYVVSQPDREHNSVQSRIWIVPSDGSAPGRPFTAGPKRDASPRWSPDGTQLAFVSNRETDAAQLWVIPVAGGEPVRLTDLRGEVSEPAWSPDGTRIAFCARVPDAAYDEKDDRKRRYRRFTRLNYKLDNVGWIGDRPTHVFVVEEDGGSEPAQITDGPDAATSPAWSPDGSTIAFVSGRHPDADVRPDRDIYLVDARGGEVRRLTNGGAVWAAPSYSPDGSLIAARVRPGVLDSPRHTQIATVDPSGGEIRVLSASLDRNCAPFGEARDPVWHGVSVLFAIEDRGNTHVYSVAASGAAPPVAVVTGELRVAGYDAAGGLLVWVATTQTTTTDLYCADRRLTHIGQSLSDRVALQRAERFTATSADGSPVDAWIMPPAEHEPGQRSPVLVNIHGGPFTQYGSGFFDEFQVFAGAGYAVVFSNPRGSSGYAESWGRAIRGPVDGGPGWGTLDYEDVMAVTEAALERFDFCDPDRVGVMGGSYGGYLTSWIVGHNNRFSAACSERAVNNWLSMFGSSDIGWTFKSYFGAFAFEDADAYLRHSPSTYADRIETPLLILHAENDLRCPVEQAEHLFTAMRLMGKTVEFVRFPGEGHEMSRSGSPEHRVMRFDVILEWFDRWLKTGAQDTAGGRTP